MMDEKRLEEIRQRAAEAKWDVDELGETDCRPGWGDVEWLLEELEHAQQERRGARDEVERLSRERHTMGAQSAEVVKALKAELEKARQECAAQLAREAEIYLSRHDRPRDVRDDLGAAACAGAHDALREAAAMLVGKTAFIDGGPLSFIEYRPCKGGCGLAAPHLGHRLDDGAALFADGRHLGHKD